MHNLLFDDIVLVKATIANEANEIPASQSIVVSIRLVLPSDREVHRDERSRVVQRLHASSVPAEPIGYVWVISGFGWATRIQPFEQLSIEAVDVSPMGIVTDH